MSNKRRMKKLKRKQRIARKPPTSTDASKSNCDDDEFLDDNDDDDDDDDDDDFYDELLNDEDDWDEVYDSITPCDCQYCRTIQDPVQLDALLAGTKLHIDLADAARPEAYAIVPARQDSPMLRHVLNQSFRGFVLESPWMTNIIGQHGPRAFDVLQSMELEFRVVPD